MKTAEKFKLPVFTFVDTPGAYPGIDAEERGQSEAIGRNIFEMAQLEVPIITTIIGEGGSGGALAISVGDQVLMLQYAIYSVISPEGCASILWKTSDKAQEAAEALGITAHRLKALGLVDKIVSEPVGGAHRDPKQMAAFLKRALGDAFRQVATSSPRTCWTAAMSACKAMAASRHQGRCQSLNVPLWVKRLDARHTPGQSPEDAARQARYKAFEAVAIASKAQAAIKSIAIAQHADDQVETLLLALSRGAGIAGLAAMPARWERAGVVWHRPLLQVAGADIRSWLRLQGQPWVEDPTNTDQRYTRNRIRAQLLPALEAAFPAFRDTFARSASNAAQAAELLDELAQHTWH
jgi:tRNA(Ile)-lysidine synthetase-like protein